MKFNKPMLLVATILTLAVLIAGLAYWKYAASSKIYIVENISPAICTEDIPTSSCGPSNVEVVSETGEHKKLVLPGFDSPGMGKDIQEIAKKLYASQEQHSKVKITVTGGTITFADLAD